MNEVETETLAPFRLVNEENLKRWKFEPKSFKSLSVSMAGLL
jgi:hypothetical protein